MKMKKNAYRAREIKSIDIKAVLEGVRGQRVVVATDVAKSDMFSAVELWDGSLVALIKWQNPSELRQFVGLVVELAKHAQQLECVQEPTGTYGDPLRVGLEAAGMAVYRVSPKHVHDLQETYDGTPSSHDRKAARVIAKVHHDGMSSLWSEETTLAPRHRSYDWFADELQRLRGRLEARLARHWPEVMELLELDSTTLLELLKHYASPAAVAKNLEESRSLMRSAGRGLLAPDKITAVLQSATATVGVAVSQAEAAELQLLSRELLRVKEELTKSRSELCTAGAAIPCVQHLEPVVGSATATVLYALLGDPAEYDSASAYVKAAGLNLRENSSGKKQGQLTITKRGPSAARRLLYFAAMRLVQRDALFKAWHERKLKRSGARQGKKSIIALTRKLLAALWHVGRGSAFDSSLLFNTAPLSAATN